MATKRKVAKTKPKKPAGPSARKNFGWAMFQIPLPTIALLGSISKLVDIPPADILTGLVNELGEQVAAHSRDKRAQSIGVLSSLLKLPAFKEALLEPPKRKRATKQAKTAPKRSAKRSAKRVHERA